MIICNWTSFVLLTIILSLVGWSRAQGSPTPPPPPCGPSVVADEQNLYADFDARHIGGGISVPVAEWCSCDDSTCLTDIDTDNQPTRILGAFPYVRFVSQLDCPDGYNCGIPYGYGRKRDNSEQKRDVGDDAQDSLQAEIDWFEEILCNGGEEFNFAFVIELSRFDDLDDIPSNSFEYQLLPQFPQYKRKREPGGRWDAHFRTSTGGGVFGIEQCDPVECDFDQVKTPFLARTKSDVFQVGSVDSTGSSFVSSSRVPRSKPVVISGKVEFPSGGSCDDQATFTNYVPNNVHASFGALPTQMALEFDPANRTKLTLGRTYIDRRLRIWSPYPNDYIAGQKPGDEGVNEFGGDIYRAVFYKAGEDPQLVACTLAKDYEIREYGLAYPAIFDNTQCRFDVGAPCLRDFQCASGSCMEERCCELSCGINSQCREVESGCPEDCNGDLLSSFNSGDGCALPNQVELYLTQVNSDNIWTITEFGAAPTVFWSPSGTHECEPVNLFAVERLTDDNGINYMYILELFDSSDTTCGRECEEADSCWRVMRVRDSGSGDLDFASLPAEDITPSHPFWLRAETPEFADKILDFTVNKNGRVFVFMKEFMEPYYYEGPFVPQHMIYYADPPIAPSTQWFADKHQLCYDTFDENADYVDAGGYEFHTLVADDDWGNLYVGGEFRGSVGGVGDYFAYEDHYLLVDANNDAVSFSAPAFFEVSAFDSGDACGLEGECAPKEFSQPSEGVTPGFCSHWGHPYVHSLPAGADVDLDSNMLDYSAIAFDGNRRTWVGLARGTLQLEMFDRYAASVLAVSTIPDAPWEFIGSRHYDLSGDYASSVCLSSTLDCGSRLTTGPCINDGECESRNCGANGFCCSSPTCSFVEGDCPSDSCSADTGSCGFFYGPAECDGYCNGESNNCVAKKDLGEECAADFECSSNECVEGVCCAVSCDGPCALGCNAQEGFTTCEVLQPPADPDPCDEFTEGTGLCGGRPDGECSYLLDDLEVCNTDFECRSGHCIQDVFDFGGFPGDLPGRDKRSVSLEKQAQHRFAKRQSPSYVLSASNGDSGEQRLLGLSRIYTNEFGAEFYDGENNEAHVVARFAAPTAGDVTVHNFGSSSVTIVLLDGSSTTLLPDKTLVLPFAGPAPAVVDCGECGVNNDGACEPDTNLCPGLEFCSETAPYTCIPQQQREGQFRCRRVDNQSCSISQQQQFPQDPCEEGYYCTALDGGSDDERICCAFDCSPEGESGPTCFTDKCRRPISADGHTSCAVANNVCETCDNVGTITSLDSYLKRCPLVDAPVNYCVEGQCISLECESDTQCLSGSCVNNVCCPQPCEGLEGCSTDGPYCRNYTAIGQIQRVQNKKRAIDPVVGMLVELWHLVVPEQLVDTQATNADGNAVFDQVPLKFGETYEMRVTRDELLRYNLQTSQAPYTVVRTFDVDNTPSLTQGFARRFDAPPLPTPVPTPLPTPRPPTLAPTPVPIDVAGTACEDIIIEEKARFISVCRSGANGNDPCALTAAGVLVSDCYNSLAACVAAKGLPGTFAATCRQKVSTGLAGAEQEARDACNTRCNSLWDTDSNDFLEDYNNWPRDKAVCDEFIEFQLDEYIDQCKNNDYACSEDCYIEEDLDKIMDQCSARVAAVLSPNSDRFKDCVDSCENVWNDKGDDREDGDGCTKGKCDFDPDVECVSCDTVLRAAAEDYDDICDGYFSAEHCFENEKNKLGNAEDDCVDAAREAVLTEDRRDCNDDCELLFDNKDGSKPDRFKSAWPSPPSCMDVVIRDGNFWKVYGDVCQRGDPSYTASHCLDQYASQLASARSDCKQRANNQLPPGDVLDSCRDVCTDLFDGDDSDPVDQGKPSWPSQTPLCNTLIGDAQAEYARACETSESSQECFDERRGVLVNADTVCQGRASSTLYSSSAISTCQQRCSTVFNARSNDPDDVYQFTSRPTTTTLPTTTTTTTATTTTTTLTTTKPPTTTTTATTLATTVNPTVTTATTATTATTRVPTVPPTTTTTGTTQTARPTTTPNPTPTSSGNTDESTPRPTPRDTDRPTPEPTTPEPTPGPRTDFSSITKDAQDEYASICKNRNTAQDCFERKRDDLRAAESDCQTDCGDKIDVNAVRGLCREMCNDVFDEDDTDAVDVFDFPNLPPDQTTEEPTTTTTTPMPSTTTMSTTTMATTTTVTPTSTPVANVTREYVLNVRQVYKEEIAAFQEQTTKVKQIQEVLANVTANSMPPTKVERTPDQVKEETETAVQEAANAVNETVAETETSVDDLADRLEQLWREYNSEVQRNGGNREQACNTVLAKHNIERREPRYEYSEYFGREVDMTQSTVVRCAGNVTESVDAFEAELCYTAALDETFIQNRAQNPELAWQTYVNQETGAVRIFPGLPPGEAAKVLPGVAERCDPRQSTTYAAPAFGPRKVLLLLDTLAPDLCRAGGGLERAKKAVAALLDTTSEDDLVALVLPQVPAEAGCLSDGFVRATKGNVRVLKQLVEERSVCAESAAKTTDYATVMDSAFDILSKSAENGNEKTCQAAVVLVTAVPETVAPAVQNAFDQRNDATIGARLFLYTIGRDHGAVDRAVCDTGGDAHNLDSDESIGAALNSFFRLAAGSVKATATRVVQWSEPRDEPEIGPVLTAATPVYASSAGNSESRVLLGVVTTDVNVDVISKKLLQVPNSKRGRSYAFLIDAHGRALAHPLLDATESRKSGAGSAPDITQLEVPVVGEAFSGVRLDMATQPSGTTVVPVQLPGQAREDRVYFWKPAGGPFTVAYSLAPEDASTFLLGEPLALATTSFFHRIDLAHDEFVPEPLQGLSSEQRRDEIMQNTSVVLFAPRAYTDAKRRQGASGMDDAFVHELNVYLNDVLFVDRATAEAVGGKPDNDAPLRDGVRGDVKRTAVLEPVWRQTLDGDAERAPLRVMYATPSGMVRVMPGRAHPFGNRSDLYDPLQQSWYRRALAAGGSMAVTRPRLDENGEDLIVTVSHAIYHDEEPDVVLGVSAMDVRHQLFARVVDQVAQCTGTAGRECYLLDTEARFVTALSSDANQKVTIGESFVGYQPTAAMALLRAGLLRRKVKPDATSGVVCSQWELDITPENATAPGAITPDEDGIVEFRLDGGCPSGRLWLTEVAAPVPTRDDESSGTDDDEEALIDPIAANAPRLLMVIIDQYQFAIGRDCSSLPEEVDQTDSCEPLVLGACEAIDFKTDARGKQIECVDYTALDSDIADALRKTYGEEQEPLVCSQLVQEESSPASLNWLLIVLLPLAILCLCFAACIGIYLVRSKRNKNEVNVGVERSDQQVEAAANASDEDESWSGPDA